MGWWVGCTTTYTRAGPGTRWCIGRRSSCRALGSTPPRPGSAAVAEEEEEAGARPHTVRVRTVHQHVVRREAPAPVPEVRTGGLYRGAPCTVGTKDRLHRSLCAPSVFSKGRTLLANMTKMSEAYPQTLKNSCYNNVCAWHLRPKGHLTYQRSHFDYILTTF